MKIQKQSSVITFTFRIANEDVDYWKKEDIENDMIAHFYRANEEYNPYFFINMYSMIHHLFQDKCTFQMYITLCQETEENGIIHGLLLSDPEQLKTLVENAFKNTNYKLLSFEGMAFRQIEEQGETL